MGKTTGQVNKKTKTRRKLYDAYQKKDIRYRGPLSYRHLRILGWLCIAVSQVGVILNFAIRFIPEEIASALTKASTYLSIISSLSVPLLLLASFAVILDFKSGYKRQLITMGSAAAAVIALFELFYFRYFVGIVGHLVGDGSNAQALTEDLFFEETSSGFLAFNLFIDLLLCVLFMYFLDYRPEKRFQGKKLLIFRLFAVIPVIYELASFGLKYASISGKVKIPVALFPFLTTKPPILFFVFIVLAVFIKNRGRLFCRNGGTYEEYQAFLKTNRNSWNFSVFTSVILAIAGVLDFVLLISIIIVNIMSSGSVFLADEDMTMMIYELANKAMLLGFGKSVILLPLAPFILLFSYTRSYKNTLIDLLIPMGGIALIIFIYLEAALYGSSFIVL